MQVNCPNCGEKVTAQNINVQRMTAVCAACDSLFSIDAPAAEVEAKAKRRKVKRPASINMRDNDAFQIEFRTNFRLDRDQVFLMSLWGAIGGTVMTLILIGEGVPVIMPIVFACIALASFYRLGLTVFNKTRIEMDEDAIKVSRVPLPNPLTQGYEIPLSGVTAIKYEETAVSKKEAYDTPRYRVWAETADGTRRTIINDVTEDYAVFIAQRLEEHLQSDTDLDISHLAADEYGYEDEADIGEILHTSQKSGRR